jgi:hypothetical protein
MFKETDLAYLAGFIDGEGCFFIGIFETKSKAGNTALNYHTYIKICNTDQDVMKWIAKTFNGTNYNQFKSTDRARKFEKCVYNIQFTGQNLNNILKQIYPYLIVKRKHCEIMMRMRDTFPQDRRLSKQSKSKEIHDIRYECFLELRKLNSRFHNHPLKGNLRPSPVSPSALR